MDDCLTDLAPSPDAIPRWTAADTQAIAGVLASVPADPAVRRSQLAAVEEVLAEGEGSADLRCRRALLLDALGRTEEARQAYLAGLSLTPGHAATLNGLGALLNRTGFRAAARTVFAQAAACHPYLPLGHVNLANVLREDRELAGARRHYEAALLFSPGLPEAHQGLGQVLSDLGEHAAADRHWRIGYRDRVFTTWPYRGEGTPVRVLLLASVAGGNVPVRQFLDDRVFETIAVATEYATDEHALPPHDLVLNSIGDAELCGPALNAAEELLERTGARLINCPHAVRQTGRIDNARRFAGLDGVVAPGMTLMSRDMLAGAVGDLELIDQGFQFPLLLRAPGFHTGQHFLRVERPEHLAVAARGLPAPRCWRSIVSPPPARMGCFARGVCCLSTGRCIRCTGRFRRIGRCITSPPTWLTMPSIGPRRRGFWLICRGLSVPAPCRGWRRSLRISGWIMAGSISRLAVMVTYWCSRPTPPWRLCRRHQSRSGITVVQQ
jgi:tetratricopeptide (TPR) repeat protein